MIVKKFLREFLQLASFLVAMSGFILMMCETDNLEKQMTTLSIGLCVFIFGALLGFISYEKEDEYA